MNLRDRLVDDWCHAWRWWSVRMTALGGLLMSALAMIPVLPVEIQALFPPSVRVAVAGLWVAASIYARVAKQKPDADRP